MVDVPRSERSQASPPREHSFEHLLSLLERATEGSRELDAQIHASLWQSDDEALWLIWLNHPRCPAYSVSLDAALTLLPEGGEYSISTLYGVALVELPLNTENWQTVRRVDGNVPLAICSACLKARRAK